MSRYLPHLAIASTALFAIFCAILMFAHEHLSQSEAATNAFVIMMGIALFVSPVLIVWAVRQWSNNRRDVKRNDR